MGFANSFYPWVGPDNTGWYSNGLNWGKNYLAWYYPTIAGTPGLDFATGAAWAGFDDRSCSWGQNRWMDRQNGIVYDSTWKFANNYSATLPLKWMYIDTWNDWNEGTEIEPSIELGYLYLKKTITNINTFKATNVSTDTCKFEAARKIYLAANSIEIHQSDSVVYYPVLKRSVKYLIQGNCTAAKASADSILAPPHPIITATGLATYCSGNNSITLTVGIYAAYHWSTGATTQSIIIPPLNPGVYTVTVTASNSLTGTASITILSACNVPTIALIATTNITATTAVANWSQPSCVNGYVIRLSKHNLNTWTNYTISPNTHYTFSALAHNTSYDWQIRTNCNATQTTISTWSATQSFTTNMKEMEQETMMNSSLSIYPNPVTNVLSISFPNDNINSTINLYDMLGEKVLPSYSTQSTNYTIDLKNLSQGIYFLEVIMDGEKVVRKVIKL